MNTTTNINDIRLAIVQKKLEKEKRIAAAQQERSKSISERDDLLTLLLQKWSFTELARYYCLYFMTVLDRVVPEDPIDFSERRFAEDTLLECRPGEEVSFVCYCRLVASGVRRDTVGDAVGADVMQHYSVMMYTCIVVALVYDTRIQRLVFARHPVTMEIMKSKPPSRAKANTFIAGIKESVDAFLCRHISIHHLHQAIRELWSSDQFVLRSFSEQPFLYNNQQQPEEENDIPHIGHRQTPSTESRTDYGPLLVDELGY
jgi:hypothetical protein